MNHAFLKGLPAAQQKTLAEAAQLFEATPGQLLLKEGQDASAFFLIQSGRVAIEVHHPRRGLVRLQTVGAGEIVGWSWIVPPFRWQFDARAVEPVKGLSFDAAWLRQQCERDHELGFFLLRELVQVMAARLSATRLQLLDVYR